MKKIILLLFTFSILSCSKDDNTSSYKGKNDLLIEGSPWVYHHAEILKITNNTTPPKTKEELFELVDFQNQFLSYDFNVIIIFILLSIIIIIKHFSNIKRLLNKSENKIKF